MRKVLCILIILFASNAYSETVTYNTIGNTTYGSDGSRLTRIGNTVYSNDGTRYNTIGNTTYGSDGSRLTRLGNTQYITTPTQTQTTTPSYYDSGSSDGAAIAAVAVGAIAVGALIGMAVSNHNEEVERQFRNHLMAFERKVMTLPIY